MADYTTELDCVRTFLEAIHKGVWTFNDVVASVNTGTKAVTLTTNTGTLNQYANYCLFVTSGDNVGDEYTVVSNTIDTPTVLTVLETITDNLATDIVALYTGATTKHFPEEAGILKNIADTQRMLVFPPELMGSDGEDFYWKRYKVQVSESSEANLMTALNNIIIGIKKFNKRTTITGFTYASCTTMCHMKLGRSGPVEAKAKNARWDCDVWLDVEWSTS